MLRRLRCWFRDQPIRKKLFVAYAAAFTLLLTAGGLATDVLVRRSLEQSIEGALEKSTTSILHLLETALNGSIRNYLRGVADQDLAVVAGLQERVRRGELAEDDARSRAKNILLSQHIGKTGYVCVLDSAGTMRVHPNPELVNRNLSEFKFVQEITARRSGYLEYVWQNPGESTTRPKAMYMVYFEPWDWIILATSYRDEFRDLINLDLLKDSILALRLGQTGYSYILDLKGNILVHPYLAGRNIHELPNQRTDFFDEMVRRRKGTLTYFWKEPGEDRSGEKLVFFNELPEFDWIVASAIYLDEVYAPLRRVRALFLFFIGAALAVLLVLTYRIGATITRPLARLMARVAPESPEEERARGDEVARLAACFDAYVRRLKAEVTERQQAQKALTRSEETFRKAFAASPHGLCILALDDGRVLHVNDPFLRLIGSDRGDASMSIRAELDLDPEAPEGRSPWDALKQGEALAPRDVTFREPGGEPRVANLSAEAVEITGEPCVLLTLEDVTERRQLEREVIEAGDRERARIGQELHDDLAPHLVGIDAVAKLLADRVTPGAPEFSSARKIREWIGEAVTKVRALSRGLCAVHLAGNELELTLREMADDVTSVHGVTCVVRVLGDVPPLKAPTVTQLTYIAREAVHNAVKHARPRQLAIVLEAHGAGVRLTVSDDGIGFDTSAPSRGMGLRIQRYRASMVGARLTVWSSVGEGTRVTVATGTEPTTEVP